MKNILLLTVISLGLCIVGVKNARAWDFPLDIDPIAIKFNHGGANDAIYIKKNGSTEITIPEYDTGAGRNEKFAYVYSQCDTPTVKVKFFASPPDPSTSLTIDAIKTIGDPNWNLADTEMYFNGSGFSIGDAQNYVLFNTENGTEIPNSVKKNTPFYWSWRVVAEGGVPRQNPYVMGSTNHVFYTLLASPQDPLTVPWTDVLDYACVWANGKMTNQDVVEEITEGAYNNNFKNYNYETYHTIGGTCYLDSLLNASTVDCRDMSAVVQLFSNAVGVPRGQSGIQVRMIDTTSTDDGFYYKSIDPIGTPSWQGGDSNGWWYFHQVGWYNNSYVYDASIRVNQSTPRVPVGESIDGNYKTDLYNSNPNQNWAHYSIHQWTPQSPFPIVNVY